MEKQNLLKTTLKKNFLVAQFENKKQKKKQKTKKNNENKENIELAPKKRFPLNAQEARALEEALEEYRIQEEEALFYEWV